MADPRDPRVEQRELVLSPNEFCFIQNTTDGGIMTVCGPSYINLGQNESLIIFDPQKKIFTQATMNSGKQHMVTAPAGWYVVLLNPAPKHPTTGKNSYPNDIQVGKRVVIPGPTSFSLWPGQMAEVVKGHQLRSNEYLLIEIYDAVAARDNWNKGTIQPASITGQTVVLPGEEKEKDTDANIAPALQVSAAPEDIANGKRYIIKGTQIAFYIPPSGVKVVESDQTEDTDGYIRRAVSLENLEYSILLDENGEKEYFYGPQVVFPKPTQNFIVIKGKIKFKAIELDARKGIYVKVIEKYEEGIEEDKKVHNVGEELFITGDGLIYMPRKEHSIIKYGDQEVHFATAIPEGEGWYVLNRDTGAVTIEKGPKMFLPDPRKEVFTRRILTPKEVNLFYPDNQEAQQVNRELLVSNMGDRSAASLSNQTTIGRTMAQYSATIDMASVDMLTAKKGFGDTIDRGTEYTKPRTIILDTKYMGAVAINVWTGYAVKVVNNTGTGRVEIGPKALLLAYNETLEPMKLSTGKPKNTDKLLETVYLKVNGNRITDIVDAETSDMVKVKIKVNYLVNFLNPEDAIKWFSIENYVKYLCDHTRSVLKGIIKKMDILTLHNNLTDIVRDSILGIKEITPAAEVDEENSGVIIMPRPGMNFENSMHIHDVEVLSFNIDNSAVQTMIEENEKRTFANVLGLKSKKQEADFAEQNKNLIETIYAATDAIESIKHASTMNALNNVLAQIKEKTKATLADIETDRAKHLFDLDKEKSYSLIEEDRLKAQVTAATNIAEAFTPQLVQAINNLKDAVILETLSDNFKDLAVLEGHGILATAQRFLDFIPQGMTDFIKKMERVVETKEKQ